MSTLQIPFKGLKYFLLPAVVVTSMIYSGCVEEDDGTPSALDLPVMTINDLTILEGDVDQVLQLTVKLRGENTTNAIVTFSAVSGTAENGLDFNVLTAGQLIFAPGDTQKIIEINLVGDEA